MDDSQNIMLNKEARNTAYRMIPFIPSSKSGNPKICVKSQESSYLGEEKEDSNSKGSGGGPLRCC